MKSDSKSKRPFRILLVDDHAVVRLGLRARIEKERDLQVCAEAESAPEALAAAAKSHPDLAVVDLSLAGTSGMELIKDLHSRYPKLKILVLTMHDEMLYAERALRAGGHGFLMKNVPPSQTIEAMREVLAGQISVSSAVAKRLLMQSSLEPARGLSTRELEVLDLLGLGRSAREIASNLRVSVKTVDAHAANIKRKLNLRSGLELRQHAVARVQTERDFRLGTAAE